MKITALSTLLLFLPTAYTAVISAHSTTVKLKLHKRLYTSSWAVRFSVNRFIYQGGHMFQPCLDGGDTDTDTRFFTWDGYPGRETGTKRPQLAICTETFRCGPDHSAESIGTECPATEEEFIQKLMDGIENKGLQLTIDDVYKRLHEIDSEAFPFATLEEKKAAEGRGAASPTGETGVKAPGWTQEGVAKDCKKWVLAKKKDSCYGLADEHNVSVGDFYKWNPAVNKGNGRECGELWIGYAYCVGV